MDAVILGFITLLTEIANLTTSSSEIAKILQAIINILPTLEAEYQALVAPVQNIISALSKNPATTASQLTVAQQLEANNFSKFMAAVIAYNTANPQTPITIPTGATVS